MPIKPLDTLLAIKVLSFVPGLTANARAVGTVLLERFNRRTGRCDPGIEGIATHLGISTRTVIRSTQQLESSSLFRKVRHGGYSNRNQYEPDWGKFAELEAAWRARLWRRPQTAATEVSPEVRQDCHLDDDSAVTQTCTNRNLPDETYSRSRSNDKIGRVGSSTPKTFAITPRSRDAAEAEAERRWSKALHEAFASKPFSYGDIVAAITSEIQIAATSAELKQRGAGFVYILRRLKLGPDPRGHEGP